MKKFNLLLALLIICLSSIAQEKLQLNLQKGETYDQLVSSTAQVAQTINGQNVDIEIAIIGNMSYKVVDVTPTAYEMDVKYDEIGMTMKTPQGEASFSSENQAEGDLMSAMLGNLKKKSFHMTLLKSGKIENINNMDELFAGMFDGISDITEAQRQQMDAQMKQSFGEKSLKGNLELATAIFPSEAVSVGDSWDTSTQLNSIITANVLNTYSLTEAGDGYHVITGKGSFKSDPGSTTTMNGMTMSYDLAGTIDAELKIDASTGWIIEGTVVQAMEGTASVQGMSIPMTSETQTTITDK